MSVTLLHKNIYLNYTASYYETKVNLVRCQIMKFHIFCKVMYLFKCKTKIFPLNLALKHGRSCSIHVWSTEIRLQHTGSLWTGPCRAKWRPGLPNHVRPVLFWDITQCRMVIPYPHFGTSYRSQLPGSRNPKQRTEHNGSYLTQYFLKDLVLRLIS